MRVDNGMAARPDNAYHVAPLSGQGACEIRGQSLVENPRDPRATENYTFRN